MADLAAALAAIRSGNHEVGLRALTALVDGGGPESGDAIGHRAWLHRCLGRYDEALRDYDALAARRGVDIEVNVLKAETLLLAGRAREAGEEAARALGIDPFHPGAARALLESRRAMGLCPVAASNAARGEAAFPTGETRSCRTPRFPFLRLVRDKLRFPSRYDYYEHYIRTHAPGKRLLDVGGMWLVHGRFSFFAADCGASEVVLLDVMEPSPEFRKRAATSAGQGVRYVQGDLMDPELVLQLGAFDVVFCCGVLYHLPDPYQGLRQLRALTSRQAMIGTAVVSEGLSLNRAVYYPFMDGFSRSRWRFASRQAKLALDAAYEPSAGYANWFWGTSPSCVAALARTAGFNVDDIHYRRHFAYFECSVD
jgi:tetratricopeptide (TPR) repeat protein